MAVGRAVFVRDGADRAGGRKELCGGRTIDSSTEFYASHIQPHVWEGSQDLSAH